MTDVRATVPAKLEYAGVLRDVVQGLAVPLAPLGVSVPTERLQGWGLALYEATTNIIKYGNAPSITLEVGLSAKGVVFTLWDHGRTNEAWGEPSPPPDLAEHGYGMWIIHKIMHEATYRTEPDGCNVLEMTACLPACPRCKSDLGVA
jgi:anti-sigma regulatory factor (Ser/Thr protein kinase)